MPGAGPERAGLPERPSTWPRTQGPPLAGVARPRAARGRGIYDVPPDIEVSAYLQRSMRTLFARATPARCAAGEALLGVVAMPCSLPRS
jgi:hypothetical protein